MQLINSISKPGTCLPKISPTGNLIYNVYIGGPVSAELLDANLLVRCMVPSSIEYPNVQSGDANQLFNMFSLLESDGRESLRLKLFYCATNGVLKTIGERIFDNATFGFGGVFSADGTYIALTFVNTALSQEGTQQMSTLVVIKASAELDIVSSISFPYHTNGPVFLQGSFYMKQKRTIDHTKNKNIKSKTKTKTKIKGKKNGQQRRKYNEETENDDEEDEEEKEENKGDTTNDEDKDEQNNTGAHYEYKKQKETFLVIATGNSAPDPPFVGPPAMIMIYRLGKKSGCLQQWGPSHALPQYPVSCNAFYRNGRAVIAVGTRCALLAGEKAITREPQTFLSYLPHDGNELRLYNFTPQEKLTFNTSFDFNATVCLISYCKASDNLIVGTGIASEAVISTIFSFSEAGSPSSSTSASASTILRTSFINKKPHLAEHSKDRPAKTIYELYTEGDTFTNAGMATLSNFSNCGRFYVSGGASASGYNNLNLWQFHCSLENKKNDGDDPINKQSHNTSSQKKTDHKSVPKAIKQPSKSAEKKKSWLLSLFFGKSKVKSQSLYRKHKDEEQEQEEEERKEYDDDDDDDDDDNDDDNDDDTDNDQAQDQDQDQDQKQQWEQKHGQGRRQWKSQSQGQRETQRQTEGYHRQKGEGGGSKSKRENQVYKNCDYQDATRSGNGNGNKKGQNNETTKCRKESSQSGFTPHKKYQKSPVDSTFNGKMDCGHEKMSQLNSKITKIETTDNSHQWKLTLPLINQT